MRGKCLYVLVKTLFTPLPILVYLLHSQVTYSGQSGYFWDLALAR